MTSSSSSGRSQHAPLGKVLSGAVDADLSRLRLVSPPPDQRPLATTKVTLARRMVEEGGYIGYSVDGVQRRLSGNGIPRRNRERRSFLAALQKTIQAELAAAGLAAQTDYTSFADYDRAPIKKGGKTKKRKKPPSKTRAASTPVPRVRQPTGPIVLFVGAHPDDIELGASAMVRRCLQTGYEVHFLVLTDERGVGAIRREEATTAAGILGVPTKQLHFAGFRDGKLRGGGPPVGEVRRLLQSEGVGLHPHFVVTHTQADSHRDHRKANDLVRAAFRQTVILSFSVHTSVERSGFNPSFFVETDVADTLKGDALSCYTSQRKRLERGEGREHHEHWLGELAGLPRAEAFEVDFQAVDPDAVREVLRLNDAPFHRFWGPLIADGEPVYLLHDAYLPDGQPASIERYSRSHESDGRTALRESFFRSWRALEMPLLERPSSLDDALKLFETNHVILVGGAVSNNITATYFNRFSEIDFVIECDQPGSEPVYLLQRSSGRRWFPNFHPSGELDYDVAVLSVVPSPYQQGKTIVACAGVHGRGTEGLLNFLAEPSENLKLLEHIVGGAHINIPVRVNHPDLSLSVLPEFDTEGQAQ